MIVPIKLKAKEGKYPCWNKIMYGEVVICYRFQSAVSSTYYNSYSMNKCYGTLSRFEKISGVAYDTNLGSVIIQSDKGSVISFRVKGKFRKVIESEVMENVR